MKPAAGKAMAIAFPAVEVPQPPRRRRCCPFAWPERNRGVPPEKRL
jgi:hypothetical protein